MLALVIQFRRNKRFRFPKKMLYDVYSSPYLTQGIPEGTVSVRFIPLPRTISPRDEQRTHSHVSGMSKGISSAIERTSVPIFS